jgi:hypothetical protein
VNGTEVDITSIVVDINNITEEEHTKLIKMYGSFPLLPKE